LEDWDNYRAVAVGDELKLTAMTLDTSQEYTVTSIEVTEVVINLYVEDYEPFPRAIGLKATENQVKRMGEVILSSNGRDDKDKEKDLEISVQYKSPGGKWTDTEPFSYDELSASWKGIFQPPQSAELGLIDFRVQYTDSDNLKSEWLPVTGMIEVTNNEPVGKISCKPTGEVRKEHSFDASESSDPDGTIVSYQWDFGDASMNDTGEEVFHTYTKAGNFPVKLIVTDNDGATAETERTVEIECPGVATFIVSGDLYAQVAGRRIPVTGKYLVTLENSSTRPVKKSENETDGNGKYEVTLADDSNCVVVEGDKLRLTTIDGQTVLSEREHIVTSENIENANAVVDFEFPFEPLRPIAIDMKSSGNSIKRTHTVTILSNGQDDKDKESDLEIYVEYKPPGGDWTGLNNFAYNSSQSSFQGDFSPSKEAPLGWYDFQVQYTDSDELTSKWLTYERMIEVVNCEPKISPLPTIIVIRNEEKKFPLLPYGSDCEDAPDKLIWRLSKKDSVEIFESIDVVGGELIIKPKHDTIGDGRITVTLTDGKATTSKNVSIVIVPPDEPAPVSNLKAQVDSERKILTLSWVLSMDDGAGANDVTGYDILRKKSMVGDFKKVGEVRAGVEEYQDKNVERNVDYEYVVITKDRDGNSSLPKHVHIPPGIKLSVQHARGEVVLVWDTSIVGYESDKIPVSEYKVYRSKTKGQYGEKPIAVVREQKYTDKTVTNGQRYYYIVKAFSDEGESTSNEIKVFIDERLISNCFNYPNPAKVSTIITCDLTQSAQLNIEIYNIMGELVFTRQKSGKAGNDNEVRWDLKDIARGCYILKVEATKSQTDKDVKYSRIAVK